jgi:hypothetical protein
MTENKFNRVINYVWQLPQNIIALILLVCLYKDAYVEGQIRDVYTVVNSKLSGYISLGNYIFIKRNITENTLKHEYGHCKQSKILGPLYLIIIGIPSLIHCILYKVFKHTKYKWNYDSFYTEKWANYIVGL